MVDFDPSLLAKVAEKTLEKFRNLDKDGDGFVSRTEFQNSIIDEYQNNGQKIQEAHAQGTTIGDILANQDERFKKYDTTKGVKDKGLDFDEFSAMYKEEIYSEVYDQVTLSPHNNNSPPSEPSEEPVRELATKSTQPSDVENNETEVNKTSFTIFNQKKF